MSTYRRAIAQDHTIAAALAQTQKFVQARLNTSSNIGRDKSFVDDLNKERGIVRVRVAFVPRSAEIQPFVLEICYYHIISHIKLYSNQIKLQTKRRSNQKQNHKTKNKMINQSTFQFNTSMLLI
jgi:hypothetical protein